MDTSFLGLISTGIGVGMVVVSSLVAIYYNMIIGWSLYYLFASFTSELPWQKCRPEWSTPSKLSNHFPLNTSDPVGLATAVRIRQLLENWAYFFQVFNIYLTPLKRKFDFDVISRSSFMVLIINEYRN